MSESATSTRRVLLTLEAEDAVPGDLSEYPINYILERGGCKFKIVGARYLDDSEDAVQILRGPASPCEAKAAR